jgi:hypothetical protein
VLTPFDDYPIHQTPEPVAHTASGDRNHYDRYFFNGYTREGDLFFAVALGVYPNRQVMDAAISVVRGGVQHALHASRRAPRDRTETRVGPIRVEVVEPLRAHRITVSPNEHGIAGELLFRARTVAVEEPRFVHRVEGRVAMDATRLTQWGAFEGTLEVAGERIALAPGRVLATRDRSWGIRPVGERDPVGPPGPLPQFFWLWAPLQFDDVCTHFDVNEDAEGRRWHANGNLVPVHAGGPPAPVDEGAVENMVGVEHRIDWQPGTRRARAAEIRLLPFRGEPHVIALEPILTFQMLGIGYLHPEWGHGMWKGEEAVGGAQWKLDAVNPLDPRFLHVQQLCRARMGQREGLGVLEQLVIGPHAPSGFQGLLDGARR